MDQGESPSGTSVFAHGDPPIIDMWGNAWTLSRSGQVVVDGEHDRQTANVQMLTYINRRVWQFNDQRLWWSKTGPTAAWLPPEGTPDAPFGPAPDPRIDTLSAKIDALTQQFSRTASVLIGAITNVQNDVDELPREMIPDPHIDALAGALAQSTTQVLLGQATVLARINEQAETLRQGQADIIARLDAILAGVADNGTKADSALAELHRVVVMLLQLFPNQPPPVKRSIGANMSKATSEGSQPAPAKSGP